MKKLAFALLLLFSLLYGNDFYGDEISTYKGDYYKNESFWNHTFLENSKECDDIKVSYIRFSSAEDRIFYLGDKTTESSYKIFRIWAGKGRGYGTKSIILWAVDMKKYKQGNDDEYFKNDGFDKRIELIIDKEGRMVVSDADDDYLEWEEDMEILYHYPCPVK